MYVSRNNVANQNTIWYNIKSLGLSFSTLLVSWYFQCLWSLSIFHTYPLILSYMDLASSSTVSISISPHSWFKQWFYYHLLLIFAAASPFSIYVSLPNLHSWWYSCMVAVQSRVPGPCAHNSSSTHTRHLAPCCKKSSISHIQDYLFNCFSSLTYKHETGTIKRQNLRTANHLDQSIYQGNYEHVLEWRMTFCQAWQIEQNCWAKVIFIELWQATL